MSCFFLYIYYFQHRGRTDVYNYIAIIRSELMSPRDTVRVSLYRAIYISSNKNVLRFSDVFSIVMAET